MMNHIKSTLLGVLIGSFIFLAFGIFYKDVQYTPFSITSDWIMSGLIGLSLSILKSSHLSYRSIIPIHFIITSIAVSITAQVNHWLPNNYAWIALVSEMIIIYIIVWIFIIYFQKKDAKQINQLIRQKRHS